jgi:hypothetical protein
LSRTVESRIENHESRTPAGSTRLGEVGGFHPFKETIIERYSPDRDCLRVGGDETVAQDKPIFPLTITWIEDGEVEVSGITSKPASMGHLITSQSILEI